MKYTKTNPFYLSKEWQRLRREVLSSDKYECQYCKAKGFYRMANTVHHVNHLDKHPELALSTHYVDDDGKAQRQLVSTCHDCHEREHGYRVKPKHPLTVERW